MPRKALWMVTWRRVRRVRRVYGSKNKLTIFFGELFRSWSGSDSDGLARVDLCAQAGQASSSD